MGSARNGVDVAIALAMSKKVDYVTARRSTDLGLYNFQAR